MKKFGICFSKDHNIKGVSKFPKDCVPIIFLLKYPDKPECKSVYRTCIDCRKYNKDRREKLKVTKEELKKIKFKNCTSSDHDKKCVNSEYPCNKVPIQLFYKIPNDPTSLILLNCLDCRLYHRNNKQTVEEEKQKERGLKEYDGETIECSSSGHNKKSRASKYEKSKVPVFYFYKNGENDRAGLYKTCLDCRNYSGKNRQKNVEKRESLLSKKEKFINCLDINHKSSGSIYDSENVPVENFSFEKFEKKLSRSCIDCKKYNSERSKKRKETRKQEAQSEEYEYCNCGKKIYEGSYKTCNSCREYAFKRTIRIKQNLETIKLEFIEKYEYSCQKCKCIFLKNFENEYKVEKLETYQKGDVRYLSFNDKEIPSFEFIKNNPNHLELRIMEFDHLTEQEILERGLMDDSENKEKIRTVRKMQSEQAMRLEVKKCQLLCAECHLRETISREKRTNNHLSKNRIIKEKYVNQLKKTGCCICEYKTENLFRFLEMDHIKREHKKENVCMLVCNNKYSLNDVIEECKKCRVLCRHCHLIHSDIQRSENKM